MSVHVACWSVDSFAGTLKAHLDPSSQQIKRSKRETGFHSSSNRSHAQAKFGFRPVHKKLATLNSYKSSLAGEQYHSLWYTRHDSHWKFEHICLGTVHIETAISTDLRCCSNSPVHQSGIKSSLPVTNVSMCRSPALDLTRSCMFNSQTTSQQSTI